MLRVGPDILQGAGWGVSGCRFQTETVQYICSKYSGKWKLISISIPYWRPEYSVKGQGEGHTGNLLDWMFWWNAQHKCK